MPLVSFISYLAMNLEEYRTRFPRRSMSSVNYTPYLKFEFEKYHKISKIFHALCKHKFSVDAIYNQSKVALERCKMVDLYKTKINTK